MAGGRSRSFEVEHAREAKCAPEQVIGRILDPSTWPSWQPEIISTEAPSPPERGRTVDGRARMLGFVMDGRSTAISTDGGLFEEDVIVGVRLRVRYELRPSDGGVIVIRRLTASLPRGISGRILSFFLKWRLKRMQGAVLDELVRQSERS